MVMREHHSENLFLTEFLRGESEGAQNRLLKCSFAFFFLNFYFSTLKLSRPSPILLRKYDPDIGQKKSKPCVWEPKKKSPFP